MSTEAAVLALEALKKEIFETKNYMNEKSDPDGFKIFAYLDMGVERAIASLKARDEQSAAAQKPGQLEIICDCNVKDALVCKEHPDCRPSYCKMRKFDPPIFVKEKSAPPVKASQETKPAPGERLMAPGNTGYPEMGTQPAGGAALSVDEALKWAHERTIEASRVLAAEVRRLRAVLELIAARGLSLRGPGGSSPSHPILSAERASQVAMEALETAEHAGTP